MTTIWTLGPLDPWTNPWTLERTLGPLGPWTDPWNLGPLDPWTDPWTLGPLDPGSKSPKDQESKAKNE